MPHTDFLAADGNTYPVSVRVADQLTAAFGNSVPTREMAKAYIKTLLAASDERILTEQERTRLAACDVVINLNKSALELKGRPVSDFFGSDGTLCQVHGNHFTHACGCITAHIFDHHKRHLPDELTLHAHHSPYVCSEHEHLRGDFKAHYALLHVKHPE